MSEQAAAPLMAVIELSKVDVLIARLTTQKKQIEAELLKRRQTLAAQEARRDTKKKLFDEKRIKYQREEKYLNEERDKLVDRRKALTSLNNYKLQQAAEREIEYASKQLSMREDAALGLLKESETLEAEYNELATMLEGLRSELAAYEKEANETLPELEKRNAEYTEERKGFAAKIGAPQILSVYNRAKDRYPMDPVVNLLNRDTCAGCHMRVGPQVLVQISRNEIVKCPGCGRILKLEEAAAAA